jgi:hypothetical protein
VKKANDCLTENLTDFKRVKRQWQSPKKRSASRSRSTPKKRSASRRRSIKKVYPTAKYEPKPRAHSIKKALSPDFLAELRAQAYSLRGQSPVKRYSSPKKTVATRRRVSPKKTKRASPEKTKRVSPTRRRSLTKRVSSKSRKTTRTRTIQAQSKKIQTA